MSIAPVASFPPPRTEQSESPGVASNSKEPLAPKPAVETARTVSGTESKQQSAAPKNVPALFELPQDVVEVHQDPDIKDQIIIQYLDPAKNVVLQVPSNQELDVERAIVQEFNQAAKLHAAESTPTTQSEGGKTHGD